LEEYAFNNKLLQLFLRDIHGNLRQLTDGIIWNIVTKDRLFDRGYKGLDADEHWLHFFKLISGGTRWNWIEMSLPACFENIGCPVGLPRGICKKERANNRKIS
jgi:hypothetical protein